MPPMPRRRHLIPLLVAILVIQGLAGVVPHTHGPAGFGAEVSPAESGVITSQDAREASHDCLACSVHTPVVEPAAESGPATKSAVVSTVLVVDGSGDALSTLSPTHPRGPPRVV